MGCKKAQEFLGRAGVAIAEQVDAGKSRFNKEQAVALARGKARKIIAGRGGIFTSIDLQRDAPDDEALAAILLGPTGNLKAPTILVGETMIVGFNPDTYKQFFRPDVSARHC